MVLLIVGSLYNHVLGYFSKWRCYDHLWVTHFYLGELMLWANFTVRKREGSNYLMLLVLPNSVYTCIQVIEMVWKIRQALNTNQVHLSDLHRLALLPRSVFLLLLFVKVKICFINNAHCFSWLQPIWCCVSE